MKNIKKFFNLCIQDTIILSRNWIFYVLPIMAVIIIILTNWVIPKDMEIFDKNFFIYENNETPKWTPLFKMGISEDNFFNSLEDLKEAVAKKNDAMGIMIEGDTENPKFTLIHHGTESDELINFARLSLEGMVRRFNPTKIPRNYKIETLRSVSKPVPINLSILPVLLVYEAGLLGIFLIGMMIFQEKQEGSIKAYRVAPGGCLLYISSKIFVNVIFSTIYGVIIAIFTLGFTFNYFYFILYLMIGAITVTLLGLITSVFYNDLSEYFFIIMGLLLLLTLPVFSYFMPNFYIPGINLLPSYPMIFGFREIFFPTGRNIIFSGLFLTLIIEFIVLFTAAYFIVKAKLIKEGK